MNNAKKTYYIAYGSNLNVSQMAFRCPDAEPVGKTVLKNWRLVFNGVATIVRDEGCKVPVGIWKISESDERSLDRYEGYPRLYRKETMLLRIVDKDGKSHYEDAIVYIMNEGRRQKNPPTEGYYKTIRDGYRDFGIKTDVLESAVIDSMH